MYVVGGMTRRYSLGWAGLRRAAWGMGVVLDGPRVRVGDVIARGRAKSHGGGGVDGLYGGGSIAGGVAFGSLAPCGWARAEEGLFVVKASLTGFLSP